MKNDTVPIAVYNMLFQRWEEEVKRNARLQNAITSGCKMHIQPGKAKIIGINSRKRRHWQ